MIFKRPSVTGLFGRRMAAETPDRSKATPDAGTTAVSAWYKKGYDLGMGSGKTARNGVGTFKGQGSQVRRFYPLLFNRIII
jgi:hypothetical protein